MFKINYSLQILRELIIQHLVIEFKKNKQLHVSDRSGRLKGVRGQKGGVEAVYVAVATHGIVARGSAVDRG